MQLFGIYIPKNEHWYAKDLSILIYNKERKYYLDLTDQAYEQLLETRIRQRYAKANNTKTLIEILKEYYKEIQKKEDE